MREHHIKCWPEYFEALWRGDKTFEYRVNDRDYHEGEILVIKEYFPDLKRYSGRRIECNIGYVLYGGVWGLPENMCIMSIGNCTLYDEKPFGIVAPPVQKGDTP